MWRTYVICALLGLLVAATVGSASLVRQLGDAQASTAQLQQRVAAVESTQTSLQQRVGQLAASGPTSTTRAPTPTPTPAPAPLANLGAPRVVATPAPVIGVPAAPVPTVNTSSATSPSTGLDPAVLQQIEADVSALRGLQPKDVVQLKLLDQTDLQKYFVDRFSQDYLPIERETDQKLLATLGVVGPNDSVLQILLDVLQEQVIGDYSQDDKTMYLVDDNGQLGPAEKVTFAHEFDQALQDQYFDLSTLMPDHPDNDDQSLAVRALTEGDATLMQRLWAQTKLSPAELTQLSQSQSGATSQLFSAPLFLREQLLFPYGDGFNFVRQIYQTSGYAGVDDVFRNPPDSTAQILHPDKYQNHIKPVFVTLPDLSQGALGDGWRQINSNVMGELDLRLILTQLTDSATGVRGSDGWSGDRWELLEKDGHQALAIKSVWDTEDDATSFFNAFAMGLKNRFYGATEEEASSSRQALTATNAATDVRRNGQTVLAVISFDRPSADAIATAVAP